MQKKYGVSKPYDDGYQAFFGNARLSECPYRTGSADAENWREGWKDASLNKEKSVRADTFKGLS